VEIWKVGIPPLPPLGTARWRSRGESGGRYVQETFETEVAMQRHLAVYESLLPHGPSAAATV